MKPACASTSVGASLRAGVARPGHAAPAGAARSRAAGFTLVELLVVLTIIGLAGVAVVMTAPTDDPLLRQGERFAAHLALARDEAILGTRMIEVTATAQGYGFTRQHFGDWQALQQKPFGNVLWEDGIAPVLPRDSDPLTFHFDPTGASLPQSITLGDARRTVEVSADAAGKVAIHASAR